MPRSPAVMLGVLAAAALVVGLLAAPSPGPPGTKPYHPAAVNRIFARLPSIPAGAEREDVIRMLGLPSQSDHGDVKVSVSTELWDVAPGCQFCLVIQPAATWADGEYRAVFKNDELVWEVVEAGVSRHTVPRLPPDAVQTIYRYRFRTGTAYNEEDAVRLMVR